MTERVSKFLEIVFKLCSTTRNPSGYLEGLSVCMSVPCWIVNVTNLWHRIACTLSPATVIRVVESSVAKVHAFDYQR